MRSYEKQEKLLMKSSMQQRNDSVGQVVTDRELCFGWNKKIAIVLFLDMCFGHFEERLNKAEM